MRLILVVTRSASTTFASFTWQLILAAIERKDQLRLSYLINPTDVINHLIPENSITIVAKLSDVIYRNFTEKHIAISGILIAEPIDLAVLKARSKSVNIGLPNYVGVWIDCYHSVSP